MDGIDERGSGENAIGTAILLSITAEDNPKTHCHPVVICLWVLRNGSGYCKGRNSSYLASCDFLGLLVHGASRENRSDLRVFGSAPGPDFFVAPYGYGQRSYSWETIEHALFNFVYVAV